MEEPEKPARWFSTWPISETAALGLVVLLVTILLHPVGGIATSVMAAVHLHRRSAGVVVYLFVAISVVLTLWLILVTPVHMEMSLGSVT